MAWPARFGLLNSRSEDCPLAPIGNDENGMRVSVALVIVRLGVDPGTEAGRLAQLPRVKAAETLASMIRRIPLASCEARLAENIADRPIALLPASADNSLRSPTRLSGPA